MSTSDKQYRGVTIMKVKDDGIGRFAFASAVDGKRLTWGGTMTQVKRAIDKALTSDRVGVDQGGLVFPTSHDYFALAEGGAMPTAEQVARMEQQWAKRGW